MIKGLMIVFFIGLLGAIIVLAARPSAEPATTEPFPPAVSEPSPATAPAVVYPLDEFERRITKKPFGIYITPQASPVQPERFTGYHTGADVEYGDVAGDVPVKAVALGEVVLSRTASGYGGVMIIRHTVDGKDYLVLYGHLDPKTIPGVGSKVTRGQQIGLLGEGGTAETDGERKHLHFAVLAKSSLDLKGYVSRQSDLSGWLDPVTFLKR